MVDNRVRDLESPEPYDEEKICGFNVLVLSLGLLVELSTDVHSEQVLLRKQWKTSKSCQIPKK